jgi:hypothetical protein
MLDATACLAYLRDPPQHTHASAHPRSCNTLASRFHARPPAHTLTHRPLPPTHAQTARTRSPTIGIPSLPHHYAPHQRNHAYFEHPRDLPNGQGGAALHLTPGPMKFYQADALDAGAETPGSHLVSHRGKGQARRALPLSETCAHSVRWGCDCPNSLRARPKKAF